MSTHAGPNIIEDGLVLALDAASEKSFRGEPTTNEVIATTWGGDNGPTISSITDPSLMYKNYVTHSIIGGTSRNCYLHAVGTDLSSTTSTQWTFSCYVRRADRAPITSMNVYMYYPSSDGAAPATIQDVGDGWYRLYRSRTGTAATITLAGFTGLTSGVKYYMSGPQLETKTYPTPFAGINTTRGSTVATGGGWADLSGNGNHGTVTDVLDQNGSILYNGTTTTTTIPTISLGNGNVAWTANAWVKTTTVTNALGGGSVFSNTSSGPVYSVMGVNSGKIVYWTYYSAAWQQKLGVGTTVNDGNWHMLTWVNHANSTMDMYVDGEHDSFVANSTSGNNNPINIVGGSWAAKFNGSIGNATIQLTDLSSSQVNQTFNALRGRYGI